MTDYLWFSPRGFANEGEYLKYESGDEGQAFRDKYHGDLNKTVTLKVKPPADIRNLRTIQEFTDYYS